MTRARAYAVVAAIAAVPRLAALLYERGDIVAAFREKSWYLAEVFVDSGTLGFVPDVPTASTQPLYAFFLVPIQWAFGDSWLAFGLAQTAVAVATALLVYEIGRRVVSPRAGIVAAAIATLQPYLVWHDVHVNREILDTLLGAAMVLLALVAWSRRSTWYAVALGAVTGLAILSNTRLVLLPLALAGYLLWGRLGARAAVLLLAACVLVVSPWVVRNEAQVGCFAITTDARALWKANNENTRAVLAAGGWIDDVPDLPNAPPTPQYVGDWWRATGELLEIDECEQMRLYQDEVWAFWRDEPVEKARLAAQATVLLWQPTVHTTEGGEERFEGLSGTLRRIVQPLYVIPLYALALVGLFLVGRSYRVLALVFVGYATLAAWVFAGTTRYRVSWDFVLAVLAVAAIERVLSGWRPRWWPFRPSSQ